MSHLLSELQTPLNAPDPAAEPMINARQAAAALGLPARWFRERTLRARYRIPHYRLGGQVRFRLGELIAWAARSSTGPATEVQP